MKNNPKFETQGGLDNYIDAANITTQELLQSTHPMVALLRDYIEFFRTEFWGYIQAKPETATLLFMNAYLLLLASIRMALSGHAVAVYPLLRVALESSCYGFLMQQDPSLVAIWTDRHNSKKDRNICRSKFTFPNVAKLVEVKSLDFCQLLTQAYDSLIDFGAHPNLRGVLTHTSFDEERDDGLVGLSLAGLYNAEDLETALSLCACLDFGFLIYTLIGISPQEPSQALMDRLQELSDRKSEVIDEFQGS